MEQRGHWACAPEMALGTLADSSPCVYFTSPHFHGVNRPPPYVNSMVSCVSYYSPMAVANDCEIMSLVNRFPQASSDSDRPIVACSEQASLGTLLT